MDSKPVSRSLSVAEDLGLLAGLVVLCFAAAGLGAAATSSSVGGWYTTLNKPGWNPPNWIFGPVWTTLYLMMAVSAWLVWRRGGFAASRWALILFLTQLGLNTLWSIVFFGLRQPGLAFAEILLLWSSIVATIAAFRSRSLTAAGLMIPYLAWSTFAAVLNLAIWRMN